MAGILEGLWSSVRSRIFFSVDLNGAFSPGNKGFSEVFGWPCWPSATDLLPQQVILQADRESSRMARVAKRESSGHARAKARSKGHGRLTSETGPFQATRMPRRGAGAAELPS